MSITVEQIREAEARVVKIEALVNEAQDEITAHYFGCDGNRRKFRDAVDDPAWRAKLEELHAREKELRRTQRVEELVCAGLAEQFYDEKARFVLGRMMENVEKFDGKKMSYKRQRDLLSSFGEEAGVSLCVDHSQGAVEIYHSSARRAKRRSLYVGPGEWIGGKFEHLYGKGYISARFDEYSNKMVLREDEIRVLAGEMLSDVAEAQAKIKEVRETVGKMKTTYRNVFGWKVHELEDLKVS